MARAKNYTLGAGKLYFDLLDELDQPTGEFYIGNTPSLTYSADEERQEHYSSDEKARSKDASVVTRDDSNIGFTTDDIQPENMAMMIKGTPETLTVMAAADETETIKVMRGRWYQLGANDTNPTGARKITLTTITDDAAVPVAIPGGDGGANVEFDLELGRFFVKEDAPDIDDGDSVIVTYAVQAHSRSIIVSKGKTIRGALRYIADNTTGENRDHYWPLVEFSPDGDYEFKGDDWNEMSFSGEILKKGALEKHYVDGRPITA